jgi:hypothetical protein
MADTPHGQDKDKGFWDGGAPGHDSNKEASGRPSGLPGNRAPKRVGVRTDLDTFEATPESKDSND